MAGNPATPIAATDLHALASDLRRSYRDPEHGVVVVSPRLLVRAADTLERIAALGLTDLNDSVESARDLLSAASALGMHSSAPIGVEVWIAEQGFTYDSSDTLGAYTSKDAAWTALRNWVIAEWEQHQEAPWRRPGSGRMNAAEWLATKTDMDVVAEYSRQNIYWQFAVYQVAVALPPDPRLPGDDAPRR